MAKFAKGQSGNPKGRTKGAENKATKEVRQLAAGLLDDAYRARLKQRLLAGKAPHMEPIIWYYAFGKPKETIAHESAAELVIPILRTKADVRAVLGEPDDDAGDDEDE
jgi:hypothetical protein